MSIQVLTVLVSVLLRTCIKVLSEHIRCTERHYFEIEFLVLLTLSICLSPSPTLCISIDLCVLCLFG